jgi:hypothetical protein
MGTNEQQLDLARQVAWLKDYVILDRKDYEKLVCNSKRTDSDDIIQVLKGELSALSKELDRKDDWINYWKDKYDQCLEKLKKETDKWWRF